MKITAQFTAVLTLLSFAPASIALSEEILTHVDSAALNPLSALDTAVFKSFTGRPLFSATRSVPEDTRSVVDTAAPIDAPTLNIKLLGVIVTPQGAIARVLDVDDGSGHSLREGETFNDWAVVTIDTAVLRLSKGGETIDFPVFAKAGQAVIANGQPDPDPETQPDPKAQPDLMQTPRVVRVVKPWPGTDDAQAATDASSRHAQDLIDFFGPDAGKAE